MKTVKITLFISLLILLISCENSSFDALKTKNFLSHEIGVTELKVDHYLTVGQGPFPGFFHITQQGEQIDDNHWQIQYDPITNFDYEWGYRYRLLVNKQKNNPQMVDGPTFEYKVIEVLSKEKVDMSKQFKITLKQHYDDGGSDIFLESDDKKGYTLLGIKEIDCGKFCDGLLEIEKIDKTVVGIFQHRSEKKIVLVGLESK